MFGNEWANKLARVARHRAPAIPHNHYYLKHTLKQLWLNGQDSSLFTQVSLESKQYSFANYKHSQHTPDASRHTCPLVKFL